MNVLELKPPILYSGQDPNLLELRRIIDQHPVPRISSHDNGADNNHHATGIQAVESLFHFDYGTAGFRYDHSILPCVFVRMGVLAVLRSTFTQEHVGMMVTASHNKEADNGIKLADIDGGMLHPTWEKYAMSIANASTTDEFFSIVQAIFHDHSQDWSTASSVVQNAVVHIGRDTRSHSLSLSKLAQSSAVAMGATIIDHGEVTTPQLHFFVMQSNSHRLPNIIPINPTERGYYEIMIGAYLALLETCSPKVQKKLSYSSSNILTLSVDCACGVGAEKLMYMTNYMKYYQHPDDTLCNIVRIIPLNLPSDGHLNDSCGAEYVQKNRKAPTVYTNKNTTGVEEEHFFQGKDTFIPNASLDGDVDRIVFYYQDVENESFHLLDGDKIAVLISRFIQEELSALGKCIVEAKSICCGVVQTAYANGASTQYLKNIVQTNVIMAKTGVKYVHHAAHTNFDVGIYFEANGHGTVVFNSKFYDILATAEQNLREQAMSRSKIALQRLRLLPRLINQAVGDALSDLLLCHAILTINNWSFKEWNSLYNDLPSRQYKVRVSDRNLVKTNDDETEVTFPSVLQAAIHDAVASVKMRNKFELGDAQPRAFVRPSGTEDAIRVYAEAGTVNEADELALEIAAIVHKLCGGLGSSPKPIK